MAQTTVTGADSSSGPLEITPTADPLVTSLDLSGTDFFFIQRLPVDKLISRVTLGDVAQGSGCTQAAEVRLAVFHHPTGDGSIDPTAIAISEYKVLPVTLARVTWRLANPVTLQAGHGYSLHAEYRGCRDGRYRTWAHNSSQVNGGADLCTGFPNGAGVRIWHVQGENDELAECPGRLDPTERFDPSMPGGWLLGTFINSRYRIFVTTEDPAQPTDVCENNLPGRGLQEVFWRTYPSGDVLQNVCLWPQFSPPGASVPDGWYYALGTYGNTWPRERANTPRDMYVKLEYNADDDLRPMPNCSGLLYDACEERIRDAGFTAVTRINLNASAIDFSLPPDAVKRTDPAVGTLIAVNRVVVVYTNPRRSVYRAQRFKPLLRWDTSEDYRPLNVDEFFGELRHRACHPEAEGIEPRCMVIANAASLAGFTHSGDFIHVQGIEAPEYGKDDDDYRTSRDCIGDGIYECDRGQYAATYFHHVPTGAPGGYEVFDYWWFYRFNRVPDVANEASIALGKGPLLHEGDWESISVGVRPEADAFDYVAFSQHGTWWGYLRENVECDAGGAFSCTSNALGGAWSGKRVHSYVANGTHANYPTPCPLKPPFELCSQNNGNPETGHDGIARWVGGDDPATTFTELFDERTWVRWQGLWGAPGALHEGFADGPNGPGAPGTDNGLHYDGPWNRECAPANSGCAPDLQASPTQSASTSSLRSCDAWFGQAVVALACSPGELQTGLDNATLGEQGDVRIGVTTPVTAAAFAPRHASAPGLAQALAAPLREGDEVTIHGHLDRDAVILVRLADQRHPVEVRLDRLARERRSRILRVVGGATPLKLIGSGSLHTAVRRSNEPTLRGPLLRPTMRTLTLGSVR